ncbi:hypothetical protein LTS18_001483, partial [Coniosporium uncinatum]
MSSLAQAARLYSEAIEWTKPNGTAASSMSAAQIASTAVRLASLSLSSSTPTNEDTIREALDAMEQVPAGIPSDLDTLLAEVASLRKAAIAAFVGKTEEAQEGATSELLKSTTLCYSIVFACLRFLGRYLGCSPLETADPKAFLRYGERVVVVKRMAKSFIDSVVVCCKAAIAANDIAWHTLDGALQDCNNILRELAANESAEGSRPSEFLQSLAFPNVRISNLYWAYYLQRRRQHDTATDKAIDHSLRRSIEFVRSASKQEKTSAFFVMKLEKLAACYEQRKQHDRAYPVLVEAINDVIET